MSSEAMMRPDVRMTDSLQLAAPRGERLPLAALVALGVHALGALYAGSLPPQAAVERPALEVELALREPQPALPEPPQEPSPPERSAPAPRPPAAIRPAPAQPRPAAAKAGAVLTAAPEATPPKAAEPFDFTSDPTSATYGAGVVAALGTAAHGERGASPEGRGHVPVAPIASGDGLTPLADLSERPRLRDSDPCRGHFPKNALSDAATVTVRVVIAKSGQVSRAELLSEDPKGQGFGGAARTCMLEQRFAPAKARDGRPAATAVNVNVKFKR